MSKIKHVFVTSRSEALPRWIEAFPGAVLALPGKIPRLPANDVLVWFEIRAGLDAETEIKRLREAIGTRPLIILSAMPNDDEAIRTFAWGAKGYCNAHSSAGNLKLVANVVLQGGLWLGDSLLQRLINATARPAVLASAPAAGSAAATAKLSGRETEVARAVAAGAQNKEIARQMNITERTVKAHISSIFDKLNIRDRLQLAILLNRNPPT